MKNDNYAIFSPNGTIMRSSPSGEPNIKNDFMNEVRTFGPFQTVTPKPAPTPKMTLGLPPTPEPEISYDEGGNPLPPIENGEGIADSLSGGVGAMILGPIIGHMLGNAMHFNPAATQQLTGWVEKGIHVGLDAIEISDSMKDKPTQQISNTSDQNVKSLVINNRGNISSMPDLNQNVKVFSASKDQNTNTLNMTAQQKFEAKHRVFGKKS